MARACSICTSPRRSAVDAQLVGGDSLAAVGRRYKLSADALRRHREAHLSPALATVAIERYGVDCAREAFSGTVDRIEGLIGRLESLLSIAEDRKSLIGAANIARELRQCLELVAKLRGELDERPQTTVVNVLATAEFSGIVARLIGALAPYPEARLAAANVLDVEGIEQ
ncbi:MAG TPA: hypothetical protein VMU99_09590 [Acidimicrobiales bacterium]|nr:hypothetical protein [Acidimicrobiales bacterium]